MKGFFYAFRGCLCLVMGLSLSACRREPSPPATTDDATLEHQLPDDPDADPVFHLVQQAESYIASRQPERARTLLKNALTDPAFEAHRPRVLYMTLVTLLSMNAVEEAKALLLEKLAQDFLLAQDSIGVVSEHLIAQGDKAGLLDWTATLLKADLPDPTRQAVLNWRLHGLFRTVVAPFLDDDPPPSDSQALQSVSAAAFADQLLRAVPDPAHRTEALRSAIETLSGDAPSGRAWQSLLAKLDIRLSLSQQDWPGSLDKLKSLRAQLDDAGLQRLMRAAVTAMHEIGAAEQIDVLCDLLMQWGDTHPRSEQTASYQWVLNALTHEQLALIPERIETLMDREADAALLFGAFNRLFYETVSDTEVVGRMLALADRLMPMLRDPRQRQTLKVLTLDGSFITHDYERTIALLEAGIPGRDASWHALALTKVLAHQAIDNNEPREAVKHLRAFMQAVVQSPEDVTADPATGIEHTRAMILGRNAKRIGDLLTEAGDTGAARVAYAEARVFYDQALKELDPASPSAEIARQELRNVPR